MSSLPRAIPFVGRRAELAWLAARTEDGTRLVTLLGPGGIGKTALAAEHGAGVFCDLGAATSEAGIVDTMALALGTDAANVKTALAARAGLRVLLDNFDGLTEHALATVGAWLDAAPDLFVVVTSRERLALAGEVVLEIGPLDEPLALLAAAASKMGAPYAFRAEDGAAAHALAMQLEGVALALEMGGAQLPLFGVTGMLERVRAGAALVREARGGPARHASLAAAVAGSFASLPPHAQHVLAQLTVFRGGFTGITVNEVLGAAAVNELPLLLARSLVRTLDARAARFDLYASVRAYAAEALPQAVEAAARAHTAYFVTNTKREEHANVMAVVERALAQPSVTAEIAEPALRALVTLTPLLLQRDALAQVAALVTPVIERTRDSGADPKLTARVMLLRGALRRERQDVRGALHDLLGAETMARALGDAMLAADLRVELGRTLLMAGETAAAKEHFERAGEAFASLGARDRQAHALAWQAFVAEDPRPLVERAFALVPNGIHALLVGRAAADAGDLAAAGSALDGASCDQEVRAAAWLLKGLLNEDAAGLASARDFLAWEGREAEAAEAGGYIGLFKRDAEAYALFAGARDVLVEHGQDASIFEGLLGVPITKPRAAPSLRRGWPRNERSIHARLARRVSGAPAPLPADALVIGAKGAWFVAPGETRVGLERRPSLALILDRLAEQPGRVVTSADLFRAGWPGEKALASAAGHRVRVAVATLRKLGLRDWIQSQDGGGYCLSAAVPLLRA